MLTTVKRRPTSQSCELLCGAVGSCIVVQPAAAAAAEAVMLSTLLTGSKVASDK
jgi:hypothetical protein